MLERFLSNSESNVSLVYNLPEEVSAVLFARYSRSRDSLKTTLQTMIDNDEIDIQNATVPDFTKAEAKAKVFHEKWVVGYGHASVSEHAVVHIAVEDVSIVVSKIIEDCRLASYTEKSTRYVRFTPDLVYDFETANLTTVEKEMARGAVEQLFNAYDFLFKELHYRIGYDPDLTEAYKNYPTERARDNAINATVCDNLRLLLPAAVKTNIGITVNARELRVMIEKLLSSTLGEANIVGEKIKAEALKVLPSLLKYAVASNHRMSVAQEIGRLYEELPKQYRHIGTSEFIEAKPEVHKNSSVRLAHFGSSYTNSSMRFNIGLAAQILYEFSDLDYETVLCLSEDMGKEKRNQLIAEYLAHRAITITRDGKEKTIYQQQPLRALESIYVTAEIVVDYGAWRDIQRHRMANQTVQKLSTRHGYEVPALIRKYDFLDVYCNTMNSAVDFYEGFSDRPEFAQYVVPLGYYIQELFSANLRECFHFIELRSGREGHPSYRLIAQDLYNLLNAKAPDIMKFCQVDLNEYTLTRK